MRARPGSSKPAPTGSQAPRARQPLGAAAARRGGRSPRRQPCPRGSSATPFREPARRERRPLADALALRAGRPAHAASGVRGPDAQGADGAVPGARGASARGAELAEGKQETGRYLQHALPTRAGRVDERVVQVEKDRPHSAQPHTAAASATRKVAATDAATAAATARACANLARGREGEGGAGRQPDPSAPALSSRERSADLNPSER